MNLAIPFRPKWVETLKDYSRAPFRRDFTAGLDVLVMAYLFAVAFAIASSAKLAPGLFTVSIGGGLVAALSGSRVPICGPTGALKRLNVGRQSTVAWKSRIVAGSANNYSPQG